MSTQTYVPAGHHEIEVGDHGLQLIVDPAGLIRFGGWLAETGPFSHQHIPDLIEALQEADELIDKDRDMPDSLPDRMRTAAKTLEEANARYTYMPDCFWRPSTLRFEADIVQDEDTENAQLEAHTEKLARDMFEANRKNHGRRWGDPWELVRTTYIAIAHELINAGWDKL